MQKNFKKKNNNINSLPRIYNKTQMIGNAISEGANSFLLQEYRYVSVFVLIFSIFLMGIISSTTGKVDGIFTVFAFILGAFTSIVSGFIGMRIAVFSNTRTALMAMRGIGPAFLTAFKAGLVMGFALVSLGLFNLFIAVCIFKMHYKNDAKGLFEAISAYGLGGSAVGLFGRVGGGIYTKAADVGADLVGKLEQGIPEDDPRNPATIADNVGDNVGDIAGMGADLFGSFAEATCAALVISAEAPVINGASMSQYWVVMMFPLLITAYGIISCLITALLSTHVFSVKTISEVESNLKKPLVISTVLNTPIIYILCVTCLPKSFHVAEEFQVESWQIFVCIIAGLWAGLLIGFLTEYFTSHSYTPVREVAESCQTGAATNIIYGLALGYKSTIVPVFALAAAIFVSFKLSSAYGVALAALGILSTLPIALCVDAYGPVSDNAGGIAEMAGMGADIREKTDALDAAGNTTAAIGKGFAIGSAAFVSLSLAGAFCTRAGITSIDILRPYEFAGLLVGAMLPYWFSAMTMKAVGIAALAMVAEVRRQFSERPGIMDGTELPDYGRCVRISTDASLKLMVAPGALVILAPILTGFIFGKAALAGLLAGALVSGVQMAISASNTGGAWDNAKKYIESGKFGGKGSSAHTAAVIGDTVGDPLKDTSGPSLNILIKLMAIISVVLAAPIAKYGGIVGGSSIKGVKKA
jgi:H(+)-translocating pyrophosphatase